MTSFGFWQDMALQSGRFFCMICFETFDLSEAHVDDSGDKWDICNGCHEVEEELLRRKETDGPNDLQHHSAGCCDSS